MHFWVYLALARPLSYCRKKVMFFQKSPLLSSRTQWAAVSSTFLEMNCAEHMKSPSGLEKNILPAKTSGIVLTSPAARSCILGTAPAATSEGSEPGFCAERLAPGERWIVDGSTLGFAVSTAADMASGVQWSTARSPGVAWAELIESAASAAAAPQIIRETAAIAAMRTRDTKSSFSNRS